MADGDWFAPKAHGYGAGMPISWQGWASTIAFLVLVLGGGAILMPRHPMLFTVIVLIATAAFTLLAAHHTRGGWKWRWGKRD